MRYEINGYIFDGGGACPEQYEVYKNEKYMAYVRFRWGSCTVHTEPLGEYICSYDNFNTFQGKFNTEKQRLYYLKLIANQINKFYAPKKPKRKYTKKAHKNLIREQLANMLFKNIIENNIEDNGIKVERFMPKRILGASFNGKKNEK